MIYSLISRFYNLSLTMNEFTGGIGIEEKFIARKELTISNRVQVLIALKI